jgi:hypothetical protein
MSKLSIILKESMTLNNFMAFMLARADLISNQSQE